MKKESESLMNLLEGERVYKPPFWEVWFAMGEFFEKRYGDYQKVENRIKMAEELGMAAVLLGGVSIGLDFAEGKETANGTTRYAGGSLTSLGQLEEKELPDWRETIKNWEKDQKIINGEGFVSWVVLPWCFHAIATSMGHEKFCYKLYDDFQFIDRAFEWVEERNRIAIDTVIKEVKPDFVLFDGDCAYKTGLMIILKPLRNLCSKEQRKLFLALKHL